MKMSKYSDMEEMLRKNKGYLFSSEIEEANISRTYLGRFVKENKLEMVSKLKTPIYLAKASKEARLISPVELLSSMR